MSLLYFDYCETLRSLGREPAIDEDTFDLKVGDPDAYAVRVSGSAVELVRKQSPGSEESHGLDMD